MAKNMVALVWHRKHGMVQRMTVVGCRAIIYRNKLFGSAFRSLLIQIALLNFAKSSSVLTNLGLFAAIHIPYLWNNDGVIKHNTIV